MVNTEFCQRDFGQDTKPSPATVTLSYVVNGVSLVITALKTHINELCDAWYIFCLYVFSFLWLLLVVMLAPELGNSAENADYDYTKTIGNFTILTYDMCIFVKGIFEQFADGTS